MKRGVASRLGVAPLPCLTQLLASLRAAAQAFTVKPTLMVT